MPPRRRNTPEPVTSHAVAEIAFTPSVKAAQQLDGSRAGHARNFEGDATTFNDRLGDAEADLIAAQRSFYIATVSEAGWPCVQHRSGPRGLPKVLDGIGQHLVRPSLDTAV